MGTQVRRRSRGDTSYVSRAEKKASRSCSSIAAAILAIFSADLSATAAGTVDLGFFGVGCRLVGRAAWPEPSAAGLSFSASWSGAGSSCSRHLRPGDRHRRSDRRAVMLRARRIPDSLSLTDTRHSGVQLPS